MVREAALVISGLLAAASIAWAQADPALVAKGEKTFADKNCLPCHAIKGKGGTAGPTARGPDLNMVGARRDAQWLKMIMKNPKAVNPKSKMLPFKGNDDELDALIAYLASLK